MGAPYDGPVPIPADGGLLRVFFAEDDDIWAEEPFDFLPQRRSMGEKAVTLQEQVDLGRPASLLKRIERSDTQGAFEFMNEIESKHALAFGAVPTVGLGDASAMLRIGRDSGAAGQRSNVRRIYCANSSAMSVPR
jgi:hypothetical protein